MDRKKVMVVDGSRMFREMAGCALAAAGYDAIEACDGGDALGKLNAGRIHLLVCGLSMPSMEGTIFLHKFRSLPAHRFTPVIVVGADDELERIGLEGRSKSWTVSSFDPDMIVASVSRLLPMEVAA